MRIPASACYQVQTQGFWDRQSKHMSDLATRIVGFMSRTSKGLRSLRSLGKSQVRLQASIRQAELEGLQFAAGLTTGVTKFILKSPSHLISKFIEEPRKQLNHVMNQFHPI